MNSYWVRSISYDRGHRGSQLTAEGHAKVMDFGLAKVVQQEGQTGSQTETDSLLTEPGAVAGTVPYMPPEQINGEGLDGRSDIFSFGVILYEMLSGHHPFASKSMAATISAILTREPLPLAQYTPEALDGLQQIVSKALNKNRDERYQTTTDLLIDLNSLKHTLESRGELAQFRPSDTRPVEQSAFDLRTVLLRIRKPRVAVPAVGMILLNSLGSAWFFNRQARVRWSGEVALPAEQLSRPLRNGSEQQSFWEGASTCMAVPKSIKSTIFPACKPQL